MKVRVSLMRMKSLKSKEMEKIKKKSKNTLNIDYSKK